MFKASRPFIAVAALAMFGASHADVDRNPAQWLEQMGAAVQATSFEGTVIRIQDGKAEALKVIHTIHDGVVREKIVAQEGNGLEIIRNGSEVHCILPDRKSVLVEEWNEQSTLYSTLPSSEIRFGPEYDVAIVRKERVAGRETIMIAIRPHDSYRYGHKVWLDTETSFPLQTQLVSENGNTIEQVKFADIALNKVIQASALAPSYSTEHFTWLRQPSSHVTTDTESEWGCDALPSGFKVVDSHKEEMKGSNEMVTHILYSDGLANVSVFITPASGELVPGAARVGGSNSYSIRNAGADITAIGEVPAVTVEQIAMAMKKR